MRKSIHLALALALGLGLTGTELRAVSLTSIFPGRALFKLMEPGTLGKDGELAFVFRPGEDLDSLRVELTVPPELEVPPSKRTRSFRNVTGGKTKRLRLPFHAKSQGLHRVKLSVSTVTSKGQRANDFYTTLVEVGPERIWSTPYLPKNHWQHMREVDGATVIEYDRTPRIPTRGKLRSKIALSAEPLLNRDVVMGFKVIVDERMPPNTEAELLVRFPHQAFEILQVLTPDGGLGGAQGDEIRWTGPMGKKPLLLRAKIRARSTGWGEIRGFFKARHRGKLVVTEYPLRLQVNEHSATVRAPGAS